MRPQAKCILNAHGILLVVSTPLEYVFRLSQVLELLFDCLQESVEEHFNFEAVYVKDETDATEEQVSLCVKIVLFHLS